ncbi:hypothetical protein HanRHA438_Chr07g0301041 [Helianthus annuus]|nr:hypothetical protein HanIR_Chr07g0313441 [Helianthus annuus]KAJ0907608.1 hypothetical protein HanRHA438_Chr07g0301041 [Helianthus annuus]
MSSIGFNFAHINAQRERITEKNKGREEKNAQDCEKRNIGVKYGGNKKVHPGGSPSMDIAANSKSI